MTDRAAQLFCRDLFVRDGLDHFRPGHKHVGRILDHEDEVGNRRTIDRTTGARPHDHRNLRNDTGSQYVALEHIGVPGQRIDAFLDACPARVIETDQRRTDFHGVIHQLADFLRVGFGKRAAEYGEILRKNEDQPPVDGAVAGYHPVAGDDLTFHPEISAAVLLEHIPLFKGTAIDEQFNPLARRQLGFAVLAVDAFLTTTEARSLPFYS